MNLASATFCWQCQQSFVQQRPGFTPGYTPAPGSITAPPPAYGRDPAYQPLPEVALPTKSRSVGAIVVVALVVAALGVGGFFGWRLLNRSEVQLPQSIAGMEQMDLPALEQDLDNLRGQLDQLGFNGDAAIYGTGAMPSFLVAVVEGRDDTITEDAIFEDFSQGFQQGSGGEVSLGAVTVSQDGDAELRCSAASGGGLQAGVCMWTDSRTVGFVFSFFADANATRELTRTVRSSILD